MTELDRARPAIDWSRVHAFARVVLWWGSLLALLQLTRGHEHAMLLRTVGLGALWAFTRERRLDVLAVGVVTVLAFEPIGLGVVLAYVLYGPHYVALIASPRRSVVPLALAMSLAQIAVLAAWATPLLDHPTATEWALLAFGVLTWSAALSLMRTLLRQGTWLAAAGAVSVIPAFELIRSHTPGILLPYYLSAHALDTSIVTLQAAEPLGVLGLAWLLSMTSYITARVWRLHLERRSPGRSCMVAFAALVLVPNVFGWIRWSLLPPRIPGETIPVRIFQGQATATNVEQLASDIGALLHGPPARITILPENTLIENLDPNTETTGLSVDEVLDMIRRSGQTTALISGVRIKYPRELGGESRSRHALIAVDPDGHREVRDKLMIAAVGDHPPFDRVPILAPVGRWITGRTDVAVLEEWGGSVDLGLESTVAGNLCVEHLVPLIWYLKPLNARPSMQICITDVSAYGCSPTQFQQSRPARRLSAIELRTAFVYVANGGSEYLDARGRVLQTVRPSNPLAYWSVPAAAEPDGFIAVGSVSRPVLAILPLVITAIGGLHLLLVRSGRSVAPA